MGLYDGVTFWIERHGADGRPVSRVARPARRVEFASPEIQGMSGSQNRMIVPCVTLGRADVTNSAVTMINVVPLREASRPGAGLIELGKALGGEFRPVLGGTKQRFGVGVVVTHARPGVRGFDASYLKRETCPLLKRLVRLRNYATPYCQLAVEEPPEFLGPTRRNVERQGSKTLAHIRRLQ